MNKRIVLVLVVIALAMIWVAGREATAQGLGETAAPAPAAEAGEPQPGTVAVLMSEREKVSYCIGLDIGTNLKMQSIEVDTDMLAKGIEDALSGVTAAVASGALCIGIQPWHQTPLLDAGARYVVPDFTSVSLQVCQENKNGTETTLNLQIGSAVSLPLHPAGGH